MRKNSFALQQQGGFTLVEILLTMVILSMVMLSATYAYNYISQNWQRNQQLYERDLTDYMSVTLVYRAITDTQPKMVRVGSLPEQSHFDVFSFYFLGRANGFTAYTNTSVQNPAYPAVYRLFSELDEQGTWQLVYEEAVLNKEPLRYAEQQLPFNFRLVLARHLAQLSFEYYGWQNLSTRLSQNAELMEELHEPEWFAEYDGAERRQHPLTIQIHLDGFIWPIIVTDLTSELLMRVMEQDL